MKLLLKLVVTTLLVQIFWFLLSQFEYRWLSEDVIVILGYAGLESSLPMDTWMSWFYLAATITIVSGLLFFGSKWRMLFIVFTAFGILVLVPFSGMNIETGPSMALRDAFNMLVGALIAVIYLSIRENSRSAPEKTGDATS